MKRAITDLVVAHSHLFDISIADRLANNAKSSNIADILFWNERR